MQDKEPQAHDGDGQVDPGQPRGREPSQEQRVARGLEQGVSRHDAAQDPGRHIGQPTFARSDLFKKLQSSLLWTDWADDARDMA